MHKLEATSAGERSVFVSSWIKKFLSCSWVARALDLFFGAAAILVIWQAVILIAHPHPSILPSPLVVAVTFMRLLRNGELFRHIGVSLSRVVVSWLISAAVAIPLGLAMGRFRGFERIVDPVVELFRPISPLAWIPLAILWFGIGELGKIFVIFIATFFPILLNTVAGVKGVEQVLVRAGRVLGCDTNFALFRKVILPASMPQIVVGLRISFGIGWAAIIAAELVAARSGLGYLISNGMETLRADLVLVGMITIGILGMLFDIIFRRIQRLWGR